MGQAIEALAHFVAGTPWEGIPAAVREHAKLVVLDTLGVILAEHAPPPEHVARVDVATYRFAANMRDPEPINAFAARYSLPHAAAALILRGHAGYHAFTEQAVAD